MANEFEFTVDEHFVAIAREIVEEDLSDHEWAARESDDEFQRGRYEGGYDAIESAFCFGVWVSDDRELWFELTLEEIASVADGSRRVIAARPAG